MCCNGKGSRGSRIIPGMGRHVNPPAPPPMPLRNPITPLPVPKGVAVREISLIRSTKAPSEETSLTIQKEEKTCQGCGARLVTKLKFSARLMTYYKAEVCSGCRRETQ